MKLNYAFFKKSDIDQYHTIESLCLSGKITRIIECAHFIIIEHENIV